MLNPGTPGYKLRAARQSHPERPSQYKVAEQFGIKRPTYSAWETGENTPPTSAIRRIAEAWGLPLAWFFDGQDTPPPYGALPVESTVDRPRTLASYSPLLIRFAGIVPAGSDWGDPLASEEMIEVDAKFESPKRFAAQVAGNSCWPALVQGDLTIWHSDEAPAPGLIVLAQNTEGGCTVKELALDENGLMRLVPINTDTHPPPDGDGWKPIARLVGVIRDAGDGIERTWYNPRGLRADGLR